MSEPQLPADPLAHSQPRRTGKQGLPPGQTASPRQMRALLPQSKSRGGEKYDSSSFCEVFLPRRVLGYRESPHQRLSSSYAFSRESCRSNFHTCKYSEDHLSDIQLFPRLISPHKNFSVRRFAFKPGTTYPALTGQTSQRERKEASECQNFAIKSRTPLGWKRLPLSQPNFAGRSNPPTRTSATNGHLSTCGRSSSPTTRLEH